jgi:tetratricopeptide (TPR) repeat protein/TolB-like protein
MGDVYDMSGDICGDGVNIAARIQPFAPPGGIALSRAVYDQVRNQIKITARDIGYQKLKGIEQKVSVHVLDDGPPPVFRGWEVLRKLRSPKAIAAIMTTLFCISVGLRVHESRQKDSSARDIASRVAVLPFESSGLSKERDYLPDGLNGALITGLSRNGYRVLAKESVIQARRSQLSPAQIGRQLRIGTLVTGALTASGDSLKIAISLIDTASEEIKWSGDFTIDEKDLYSSRNRVLSGVIQRLPRSRRDPDPSHTPDGSSVRDAYVAYLKGNYLLGKRTKESLAQAVIQYRRAIELDPSFARAYSALSNAFGMEAFYGITPPIEASLHAVEYATKALSIDPDLSDALASLAKEKAYTEYDAAGADGLFRRAIATDETSASAHQWYADFLTYQGNFKAALKEADLALELDPLSPIVTLSKGVALYFSRDYDAAIRVFQGIEDYEPSYMLAYYWMGLAELEKKHYPKALSSLETAYKLGHESMTLAAIAYAHSVSGDATKAREIMGELHESSANEYISPYYLAPVEGSLGRSGEALALLKRAVTERARQAVLLPVDPRLDRLRGLPGFAEVQGQLRPHR